jgi:hypothetical protein
MIKKSLTIVSDFFAFLALESNRFLYKWNLFAWLIILVFLFFPVNDGANEIISLPKKQQKFKEIQKKYFQKTQTYEIYSVFGIKLLFIPAAAGIFSGCNAVPTDLTLKFDSIVMLQIFNNYKGKSLVSRMFQGRRGFSGVLLNLVTILALWYGFTAMHTREYLKFISQIRSKKRIFWSVVVSRFMLFSAAFLIINGILYAFVRARGIAFTGADHAGLLWQLLTALVILAVFFTLGFIIGTWKSSILSYILMFITWFGLIFVIPVTLGVLAEEIFPDSTKDYQTELENFETVVDFEERAIVENDEFDRKNMEGARIIIEDYWEIDYKKIQAREGKLKFELASNIDTLSKLSLFFPTTFYMNTSNEVSSRGYLNYLDFYSYGQEMKGKFVRFYIDRTYYNDPKKLVPFITGDEDIFIGRSRLPRYFSLGFLLHMFYGFVLLLGSYFYFNRRMFPLAKNTGAFDEFQLDLKSNTKSTVSIKQVDFLHQFLKFFFGKSTGLKWKLSLDGEDISRGCPKKCIYLPNPDDIPGDITGMQLLFLFKRIFRLSKEKLEEIVSKFGKELLHKRFKHVDTYDKAHILLGFSGFFNPVVYILKDFSTGIPIEKWKELESKLDCFLDGNTIIIDITSNDRYWLSKPDSQVLIIYKNGKYHARKRRIHWEISD